MDQLKYGFEILPNLVLPSNLNRVDLYPKRETEGSAGFDLRSRVPEIVLAGQYKLIPTGVTAFMPKDMEGQVRSRSGLALKHGIAVLNSPGTIDSDYYGKEIGVILINHSDKPFMINAGDRIAQFVFSFVGIEGHPAVRSERVGGFGSTDALQK